MNDSVHYQSARSMLIDIGNTRIKWKFVSEEGASPVCDAAHIGEDLQALLSRQWGAEEKPDRILVSNVAGEGVAEALNRWAHQHWDMAAEFLVSPAEGCGVTNSYITPSQLGIDRWLTLIAAHQNYTEPVCIVDAGTALTVDVLDQQGVHHGGLILPGLTLMRDSLQMRTKIPQVTDRAKGSLLADNTSSAVLSASLHASVALIEKVMRQWQEEHDRKLMLVITGSDARVIADELTIAYQLEPDLVMQGLELLATTEVDAC
ncbi:MAG: type III pantothenate kinase [Chromatiales bacterium]|nr:type III pantothenate kinase [Chromatiales bacterium]